MTLLRDRDPLALRARRLAFALGLGLLAAVPACGESADGMPQGATVVGDPEAETEADWAIARGTVEWALDQQLDQIPIGEVVAMLGGRFVGTPYGPGSLEIPGPERLVVNLSVFDCVTLVEHLLVLARLTVGPGAAVLASDDGFRQAYRDELTRLRYRDGILDGYPSRLHYFSEWIADAETKGIVEAVTRDLGGVVDDRRITFMTDNPDAYRQISEAPGLLESIRQTEARLSTVPRYVIPEARIDEIEGGIRNGDVIAAVSVLDGLDVAHTGIAVWRGDRLHLLHAPLVGDSVEVSERPLAERIQGFSAQTGIMVARPLEP